MSENTRGNVLKYGMSAPLQAFYHFNYSRQDVSLVENSSINYIRYYNCRTGAMIELN